MLAKFIFSEMRC